MSPANLWRNTDFNKFWLAQGVSFIGSQVSLLAIPLTAVLLLNASPMEMGLLGASAFAPFLMFGLLAGVWADRWPKRPVLIAADIGRAILLAFVPLAASFGVLRIEYLYLIQFLMGVLTLWFDVVHQAYLPSLVTRDQLIDGNSKLEVSRSVAVVAGPSLGGGAVQLVTAPLAVLADALSFLVSAFFLARIRKAEQVSSLEEQGASVWRKVGEGLQLVLRSRFLRPIAARTGTANLFDRVMQAVYILYLTRELMIEPAVLGLLFAATGIGALVGAVGAGWWAKRFGLGHAIVGASFLGGSASLLFPLAGSASIFTMSLLLAGHFFLGMSHPIYNINQVSLRQSITPHRLQGRMNASMRFMVWGTMPIGSLIGGGLGEIIGLRPTLLVGAIGVMLGSLWVLLSPVRLLRNMSDATAADSSIQTRN